MEKFKVGDRVKLASTSKYFREKCSSNPRCAGTIECYGSVYQQPVIVNWDNGYSNSYGEDDLVACAEESWPAGVIVVCKSGFHNEGPDITYGGSGYIDGKIFSLKQPLGCADDSVGWPAPRGNGIYRKALRLATPEECSLFNGGIYSIYETNNTPTQLDMGYSIY